MSDYHGDRPTPERVCVRAPNWVGDVVMATPALRAVRRAVPEAHFTAVLRRKVEPVLRGSPWFDEKLLYEPEDRWAPREFLRCSGALREGGYDLGLLLPNSFSSALMFRLGGVGRRVGYIRDMRSWLLTDPVPRPSEDGRFKPTYMVDYYLDLCERAGLPSAGRHAELHFSAEDRRGAADLMRRRALEPDSGYFLLHPGAGYGPSKRWPAERWGRLADALHSEHRRPVAVIGGPAEKGTAERIRESANAPVVSLVESGIDLHLLKPVVSGSRLLVTTDSGPRHYGVALGVPTVCLMGPTHPDYSTSDRPHDHLVRLDVECGPCQLKECPLDHRCMEDITADMVARACGDALGTGKGEDDD